MIKTDVDGMDLLPSNIDLSGAEVQLVHEVGREFVLGRVPRAASSPSTTSSSSTASPRSGCSPSTRWPARDGVLVPLECEYFAHARRGPADGDHRQGLEQAQPEARAWTACWPPCTTPGPCTPVRSSPGVSKGFGDKVFHTVISRTVRFPDATVAGEPITSSTRRRPGRVPTGNSPRRYWSGGGRPSARVPSAAGKPAGRRRTAPPRRPRPRQSIPGGRPAGVKPTLRRSRCTCPRTSSSIWSAPG